MSKWRRNKSLKKRWQKSHLIKKYGMECSICGVQFRNMKELTLDHFIPYAKGGDDDITNLRLAHEHCNQMKGGMTPEEFESYQNG